MKSKIFQIKVLVSLVILLAITGTFLSRWLPNQLAQAEDNFAEKMQERMRVRDYLPYEKRVFGELPEAIMPTVTDIIYDYHSTVNYLVNLHMERLIEAANTSFDDSEKPEDAVTLEQLLVPVENVAEDCKPTDLYSESEPKFTKDANLSTACLAVRLTNEYIPFAYRMEEWKRELFELTEFERERSEQQQYCDLDGKVITMPEDTKYVGTYHTALSQARLRTELIDMELETAQKALDLTLAAYNEFQMTIPLHMRYMRIVRELEKFRDALVKLRSIVETYPSIFPNASTTKCS